MSTSPNTVFTLPVINSFSSDQDKLGSCERIAFLTDIGASVATVRFRHPETGELRYRLGVYSLLPGGGGWGYVPIGARFYEVNYTRVDVGDGEIGEGVIRPVARFAIGMSLWGHQKSQNTQPITVII